MPNESNVTSKYEFDHWPNEVGTVFLRWTDRGVVEVVLCQSGVEHVLLRADRDQWGVWVTAGILEIASEDGTRSMLDGLIKCLQEVQKMTEFEMKEATEVPNAPDL
jgi:hypothetical protein